MALLQTVGLFSALELNQEGCALASFISGLEMVRNEEYSKSFLRAIIEEARHRGALKGKG